LSKSEDYREGFKTESGNKDIPLWVLMREGEI